MATNLYNTIYNPDVLSCMAWLLRNCKHEDNHAGMGRLAAPEAPDVHLEAMEETEDESGKPHEAGRPGMAGLYHFVLA